jgi:hypothetical protein
MIGNWHASRDDPQVHGTRKEKTVVYLTSMTHTNVLIKTIIVSVSCAVPGRMPRKQQNSKGGDEGCSGFWELTCSDQKDGLTIISFILQK